MSASANHLQLTSATPQLPVSAYFDEKIFALEKQLLFNAGPGYAGHALMVPEVGNCRSQEWFDHAGLLVNTAEGVHWMSNVCRHRQAIMLKGADTLKHLVCPLHRWTYDLQGQLIGAPHFSQQPCSRLRTEPLQNWQGLLFRGPRDVRQDLAGMAVASAFDFVGYKLDHVEIHTCNYNWKTFIEVYLEDYHVVPFHPGLGQFVTCDDLQWQFDTWYSVQTVGITSLQKSGSPAYQKWHDAVKMIYGDQLPPHGAIWLAYYPNVMIEWYPHVLVVSSLIPTDVNKTTNVVEFYYPEEIAEFEPEFVEAEQAAYMETAREDDEIAERMDQGRWALLQQGLNELGPYQSPYEDGMRHFHLFYRAQMQAAIEASGVIL